LPVSHLLDNWAFCDAETRRFNQEAAGLDGVEVVTVSMDLPFAAARWCGAAGIDNIKVCSDFRNKDFGNAYGVLLADGPLAGVLARVIFVVGKDGKVSYKQVVPEILKSQIMKSQNLLERKGRFGKAWLKRKGLTFLKVKFLIFPIPNLLTLLPKLRVYYFLLI